jgi:hypothetical protein
MSLATLNDIGAIIGVLAYVLVSGFALYLPLLALIKKREIVTKMVIPLSLTFQIVVGYIFYCFRNVGPYPLAYLLTVLILNLVAVYWLLETKKTVLTTRGSFSWRQLLVGALLMGILLYTRFYDALHTYAPGHPDEYYHLQFLANLKATGSLGLAYYAPGFHLWVFPLYQHLAIEQTYRFVGPATGLLVILALFLMVKDWLKTIWAKAFFLLLLTIPLFVPFTIQTITFWPSALSFIFFGYFIYLLMQPEELSARTVVGSGIWANIGLALTVPYLYVQYLPVLVLFWLFLVVVRHPWGKTYTRHIFNLCIVTLLGLIVAMAHVILQTKVLDSVQGGFPQIPQVIQQGGELVVSTQYVPPTPVPVSSGQVAAPTIENKVYNFLSRFDVTRTNLLPIFSSLHDLLQVKNLRVWHDSSSHRVYAWLVFCLVLVGYGIHTKKKHLVVLSFFNVCFALIMQTGVLELGFYRGRIGWYLSLLTIITLAVLFAEWYRASLRGWVTLLLVVMYIWSISYPMTFERRYCPDMYTLTHEIIVSHPDEQLTFLTDNPQLAILDHNSIVASIVYSTIQNPPNPHTYLITGDLSCDAISSSEKEALANDSGATLAEQSRDHDKNKVDQIVSFFKQSPAFPKYRVYAQSGDLVIYQYIGN